MERGPPAGYGVAAMAATADVPAPPTGYYGRDRDDLFRLVPELPPGSRALELGCGEGRLGARLRARGLEVHGIEAVPAAAAAAATRLDRVVTGDLEQVEFDQPDGWFDLLLCGDVLEHLRDPWALLRRVRRVLAPGASVVASVPNVQYFPVVLDLLRGRWEYRDQGVLDRTHLRFFTRREARRLFESTGYEVLAMPAVHPFRARWLRRFAAGFDRCSFGVLRGFLTGQVHVRARVLPAAPSPR